MQTPNFTNVPYNRLKTSELKEIIKYNGYTRINDRPISKADQADVLAFLRPRSEIKIPRDLYVPLFTHTKIRLPDGRILKITDPLKQIDKLNKYCPRKSGINCNVLGYYDRYGNFESSELYAKPRLTRTPVYVINEDSDEDSNDSEDEEDSNDESDEDSGKSSVESEEEKKPRSRRRNVDEESEDDNDEVNDGTSFVVSDSYVEYEDSDISEDEEPVIRPHRSTNIPRREHTSHPKASSGQKYSKPTNRSENYLKAPPKPTEKQSSWWPFSFS